MEMVVEKPTATSEAESYAEHKAARAEKTEAPKVETPKAEAVTEAKVEEPKTESTETARVEGEKPKKEKTPTEKRFEELTKARKEAEAKAERLERELAEARKPKSEPAAEKPKTDTKIEEDPKPRLADFVKNLKPSETYEDAVERHTDAVLEWNNRQRTKNEAKTAAELRQAEVVENVNRKLAALREKHDDVDTVLGNPEVKPTPAMTQFFVEHPAGLEVAYHLGSHPEDYTRIKALSPAEQIAEMAFIARGASPAKQEEKKPKASNAPPPPKAVGGTAPPPAKDTAEASSYAEHKRLRNGR